MKKKHVIWHCQNVLFMKYPIVLVKDFNFIQAPVLSEQMKLN